MIFSELYGAYYKVMAKIIDTAIDDPLKKGELYEIIQEHAFGESVLAIEKSVTEEKWQLVHRDGTTPLKHKAAMPVTNLQKRWLKAIALDPRMKLFGVEFPEQEGVEPLFTAEDYVIFDKYGDGDPNEDTQYIEHFRLILDAIKAKYPLRIFMKSRTGGVLHFVMTPEYLEYSEKDDKFRLIGSGRKYTDTVNLGRIVSCEKYTGEYTPKRTTRTQTGPQTVTFELVDERNSLERVLLHFAHFEKEAERLDEKRYKVSITYEKDDETEVLIRILSFGPMVKVTGPDKFIELIKERLMKQKKWEGNRTCT